MKELINYMRDLFDILEKNKTLIIDKNLQPSVQLSSFSVGLCADNEYTIASSISVAPIGHTLFVGLHELLIYGTTESKDIYFTFVSIINLALDIYEPENEYNNLDASIKAKCKFKNGMLIKRLNMEDILHQNIAAQCGTFK